MRDKVAFAILRHWGYTNIEVGDIDGRNYKAHHEENKTKRWYGAKDKSHKTLEAVKHAYRLADIAIECMNER